MDGKNGSASPGGEVPFLSCQGFGVAQKLENVEASRYKILQQVRTALCLDFWWSHRNGSQRLQNYCSGSRLT
jgi:hypothetical protein